MLTIQARNVNDAYHEAMWKINIYGAEEDTRNGKVLSVLMPVTTIYSHPLERMLFNEKRDANPYFHIMEAMWMLAGRNDVKTVEKFAQRMSTFSDDAFTLNGAYGYRWRNHFEHDQLDWVIEHLLADPNSRRAVLGMWDPMEDPISVSNGSLDVPCNTHIYFRVVGGRLDMTVCSRSNDIVWGCYGANVVHMSFLQEFVAMTLNVPVGMYYQVSNNWHMYERHFELMKSAESEIIDPYSNGGGDRFPLLYGTVASDFVQEVNNFLEDMDDTGARRYLSPYIDKVLSPLLMSWRFYKVKDWGAAMEYADRIGDGAVSLACRMWLKRRIK